MAWHDNITVPWVLKALWNPVQHLDLRDSKGEVDHGKVVPWLFLITACVAHFIGDPFTWWELLALGSLCFGWVGWRSFLKSRAVTGTFAEQHTTQRVEQRVEQVVTIREERDVAAGIDPTEG